MTATDENNNNWQVDCKVKMVTNDFTK